MTTMRSRSVVGRASIWGICIAVCLLMSLSQAVAETGKSRLVIRLSKTEVLQVPDVPGHAIGMVEQKGLNFHENGEVGTYSGWVLLDYTNGSGTHEGYGVTTFEDGSTQITRSEGSTKATKGGKISVFEGTFTFIGGTGRYEGITGKGSYTGKRVAPLDVGADSYVDLTWTHTLPTR